MIALFILPFSRLAAFTAYIRDCCLDTETWKPCSVVSFYCSSLFVSIPFDNSVYWASLTMPHPQLLTSEHLVHVVTCITWLIPKGICEHSLACLVAHVSSEALWAILKNCGQHCKYKSITKCFSLLYSVTWHKLCVVIIFYYFKPTKIKAIPYLFIL